MSQLKLEVLYKSLTVTDFWGKEVYFPFYHENRPSRPQDIGLGFNTGNHFPKSQMFKVGHPGNNGYSMYVAFREKKNQLEKFIFTVKAHNHLSPCDWELVGAIQSLMRLLPRCSSSEEIELQNKRRCTEYDRWVNPVTKSGASYKVHRLGPAIAALRAQARAKKENPLFTSMDREILEITRRDGQTLFIPMLRNYHMAYNTIYPGVPPGVAMNTFQAALDFLDLVTPNVYMEVDYHGRVDRNVVGKATKILDWVSRELFHLKNRSEYFGASEVQKIYPKGEIFHQSTTTPYEFHPL